MKIKRNEPTTENQLRRAARRVGLRVCKARGRWHLNNLGGYQIVDAYTNFVIGGVNFEMSLGQVAEFLRRNAVQ